MRSAVVVSNWGDSKGIRIPTKVSRLAKINLNPKKWHEQQGNQLWPQSS